MRASVGQYTQIDLKCQWAQNVMYFSMQVGSISLQLRSLIYYVFVLVNRLGQFLNG